MAPVTLSRPFFRARTAPLALPLAVLLTALACTQSTYPFDYFSEMHYQAFHRMQEPPRKQPPLDSVLYDPSAHPEAVQSWRNIRGAEIPYDLAQARNLRNPVPPTADNLDRAKRLFQVNCAMCHGPQGKGNGLVAGYFEAYKATKPFDFSQQETKRKVEGELWWVITNGRANMPAFKNILTEDERWLLTHFVRAVQ